MVKHITFIILLLIPFLADAQLGGNHVYEFVSIPTSARAAALGGSVIAIDDGDISLANNNPALFSAETNGKFALEYINYISDVNFGHASYARHIKDLGTFGLGLQYLSGGEFVAADENGVKYGTFGTTEIALDLSYAKSFDSIFSIGATMKPIYSQLESYNSFGLLMDIGAKYTSKNKTFTAGLVLKNMGSQITLYNDEYESVPFDIQVGVSKKLAHAPFRFSFTAHNLQKPKLTYNQSNYPEPSNVEQTPESNDKSSVTQDIFGHMIFGLEFIPTKSFFVRAGYNHLRRQELMLENKPGLTGFSWGFGFRIAKLHLSYANVRYHAAGISNHFSITTNLADFFN